MKSILTFLFIYIVSFFIIEIYQDYRLDARPGGGGSYRSSSSSSRSSSSSSRSSSSSYSRSSSSGGGSYSGSGGGNSEDSLPFWIFVGWLVSGLMGAHYLDRALSNEDDLTTPERAGFGGGGILGIFVSAALGLASPVPQFFFVFLLVLVPFYFLYKMIEVIREGREVIYVAKSED